MIGRSMLLSLLVAPTAMALHAACAPRAVGCARCARFRACADEPAEAPDVDWRELRARLVAQERAADGAEATDEGGFVYESPLIEQGSVILGGTQQEFGFALRCSTPHRPMHPPAPDANHIIWLHELQAAVLPQIGDAAASARRGFHQGHHPE
jgi:hypothetical protein